MVFHSSVCGQTSFLTEAMDAVDASVEGFVKALGGGVGAVAWQARAVKLSVEKQSKQDTQHAFL